MRKERRLITLLLFDTAARSQTRKQVSFDPRFGLPWRLRFSHGLITLYILEAMNGSVTTMVDSLLHRSFTEVDPETRLLIACCWGEMGAIDVHRLGEMSLSGSLLAEQAADDGRSWRLSQAPWQSRPIRYELTLVTNHLVVALKAAPTSLDQHKIAFAIQQILVLLDESVKMSSRSDGDTGFVNINSAMVKSSRTQMSDWLREKLSKAGVLETIEPYWSSNFTEVCGQCSFRLFRYVLVRLIQNLIG